MELISCWAQAGTEQNTMDYTMGLLVIIAFLTIGLDFINGFHDMANAIATSVSTRAFTLHRAINRDTVINLVKIGRESPKPERRRLLL